jgi:predicted NAD/FAD-dependent oxidoreductase
VIVVGAGIAGLICAATLARAGLTVTLLDKGRRPGGRVASRTIDGVTFNHGAQFAAAQGSDFAAVLADLKARGQAAAWSAAGNDGRRVSFLPDMAALPARIAAEATAAGATLLPSRQIVYLHSDEAGWRVRHSAAHAVRPGTVTATDGELSDEHDAVVLAIPSAQAAPLLAFHSVPMARRAATAVIAPCLAAMVRFATRVDTPDVLRNTDGPIAWAARESGRPGVPPGPEAWTLHAAVDWSRTHLDDAPEDAAGALLAAFEAETGARSGTIAFAHRWRYARVETAIGEPYLWNAGQRLGACGDWCIGGRLEAAFDSGLSVARALLD